MQYISLARAAEIMGVSPKTVDRFSKRENDPLKTVRFGSVRRTTEQWIQDFEQPAVEGVRAKRKSKFAEKYGR